MSNPRKSHYAVPPRWPHWRVEGRVFDSEDAAVEYAAQSIFNGSNRPYAVMQQDDRMSPAFVLYTITPENVDQYAGMQRARGDRYGYPTRFLNPMGSSEHYVGAVEHLHNPPGDKRLVARWEAKGGKRWLELYHDEFGYSYKFDNGGGGLGSWIPNDDAAIEVMSKPGNGSLWAMKMDFPSTRLVRRNPARSNPRHRKGRSHMARRRKGYRTRRQRLYMRLVKLFGVKRAARRWRKIRRR